MAEDEAIRKLRLAKEILETVVQYVHGMDLVHLDNLTKYDLHKLEVSYTSLEFCNNCYDICKRFVWSICIWTLYRI